MVVVFQQVLSSSAMKQGQIQERTAIVGEGEESATNQDDILVSNYKVTYPLKLARHKVYKVTDSE